MLRSSLLKRSLVLCVVFTMFIPGAPAVGPAEALGASGTATQPARGWHVFLPPSVIRIPTGVAIDLRGPRHAAQWGYVADAGTGKIVKFGTGGRVLRSWRYAVPGHAAVLTVGGSGNLFVVDRVTDTISKFAADGRLLAFWTPKYLIPPAVAPFTDPRGIAVDPNGKIYLADYASHRILTFSPGGTLVRSWDTYKGFAAQYAVLHGNSGPLGNPTGVVYDPPAHLFVSAVCVASPACLALRYTQVQSPGNDTLFVLNAAGAFTGYVGNFWFGLGYSSTGTPLEVPGKESEAFVHIDAMAGDGRGHTFLAGTMWPRGGQPELGVLSYSDLGHRTAPWRLPSQAPVIAVAVDGSGSVYVSQGTTLFKRSR